LRFLVSAVVSFAGLGIVVNAPIDPSKDEIARAARQEDGARK
jgi:hypothetical protein